MAAREWHARWTHEDGSVIIITGAGSGIGMSTALLAVEQGYQVAAWDIVEDGIRRTKDLAGDRSSRIHPIVCDIAEASAVEKAMEQTTTIGKPVMLVNNAGPVAIGKERGFLEMMNAAMAMIHLPTEAFLNTRPQEGASIVNISSIVGPVVGGGGSWYSCAKAGIAGFSKNLAVTLKDRKIRCNSVAPGGPIRTPRNARFIDDGTFSSILSRNPTGRPGGPDELANGIMFLLSPAASYINGHMLCIDGGLSIAE